MLDGCDVTFQGTDYGAGALTYDEEYTDTYVFNEQTNTWDLVTDTTATIANVEFTPWTVQEQVDHGCAKKPKQPPAERTKHTRTHLDCGDDVRVTTTVTVTTPYVYDAGTNTWVPGKPVKHTTTHESPVKPGECDDTEVAPTQSHSSSGPHALPASTSSTQVPTVIDAGLDPGPRCSPDGLGHRAGPVAGTPCPGVAAAVRRGAPRGRCAAGPPRLIDLRRAARVLMGPGGSSAESRDRARAHQRPWARPGSGWASSRMT